MTDERAIEVDTYADLASTIPNTLNIVNNYKYNEHHKMKNGNKMKLRTSICRPVSVVLERLPQDVYGKDSYSRITKNNQSQYKNNIQKKHQEEAKDKKKVNNVETILTLDGSKLRNKNNKHMTKRNKYECNDTTVKQVFQNRRNIDTWKYKRKYSDSFDEESVDISDMLMKRRKRRKGNKLKLKKTHNKSTIGKLLSQATDLNITDTKVLLTKLEDMHDNKYVINWKKKLTQQTFPTENLECSEQNRNLSTSTLSINSVGNFHEDIAEDNENNTSATKLLNSYDLKSKYKQFKNLKVVLVKLESLGVSFKKQHLASQVEQLMTNYNGVLNLNSSTNSTNIVSDSSESNIINKSINEASVQMSFATGENDTVTQHLINEPTMDSSISDSILQDVCNSKELPEKSVLMEHQETTENVKNVEVSKQPVVPIDESIIIPKPVENLQHIGSFIETPVPIDKSVIIQEPVEEVQHIGSLIEIPVNNETEIVDCSNNVITEEDVNNTSLIKTLITESQKINEQHSVNSDVTMNSESLEQSINDSFLYTCIACNSSFKEFRALPLHLKKCLAKSQKRKNASENNINFNVLDDSAKNAETLKCASISKPSLQQPLSTTNDSSKSPSTLTKKVSKGKSKNLKPGKKQLQNETNLQCSVCSEVFDTIVSLSDHIYKHTESELKQAYEIAKMKQTSTSNNSNEKINKKIKKKKKIKSAVTTTKDKETQVANTIEQNKTQIDDASNISQSLVPESVKEISNSPPMRSVSSPTFCDCHKPESSDERCIELVLHCSICKIIFRTKECFDAHLESTASSLCSSEQLIGTIQRLYCSPCQLILYSYVDMRRHTENHVKNRQHIKLFCHICKVRFIGMGPIFNLHWFNHMRNLNYRATSANFPKSSLVDSNNKMWSLITTDNYDYLIVTEHVCSFCNEQCFSTSQLQNHTSVCPKRKDVELSLAIPTNDDKEHYTDSDLNLRFFCTLCKVMFKEKSLFETHAVSHKQHLQPQYICLSMTDIKRLYICNVCASVYEDLKDFTTHWQDHNAIRETFMCYQCKTDFPTLETFVDHSKQCDVSSIPVHMPSCQVTYRETNHSCKICNIGFESHKALYQHSGIHNVKFPRLSILCLNEEKSATIAQKTSSLRPKAIQSDTEQLTTTSKSSTVEVIVIDNDTTEEKDRTPEVMKNVIETESKTAEPLESEIDNASVNDTSSITDADTEVLSLLSDIEADDLNTTQQVKSPNVNGKSNDSSNTDKETEIITASDVSPSNKVSVTHVNSNEKISLNETSSSLKNLEINETNMENDIIPIDPMDSDKKTVDTNQETEDTNKEKNNTGKKSPAKVPEKNNDTSKEATSDTKSNDSSESNDKSVKVPKYLRVKNISELMDQKTKYSCPTCSVSFDSEESLKNHSMTHNKELSTSSINIPVLLPNFLSGADVEQQNANSFTNSNPSKLQQRRAVATPNVSVQQQVYTPYSVSQITQQNTSMPLAPSYKAIYSIPTQDPNMQYSGLSTTPVAHNANTAVNTNGTYVLPVCIQSQNFYQHKQTFNVLQSSNVTNSPTNFIDNNHLIQQSNNVSTINVTTTPSSLSANNVVRNQDFSRTQPQDTHSRVKLQNAIHQKCSDKSHNVTPINILPKPTPAPNWKLKQTFSLPIPSCNKNFSPINSSTSIVHPQNNNQTTAVNTNNAGRISTFYQLSTENLNVVPTSTQQHTAHHKPNTTPTAVYLCHCCPQPVYFPSHQQLDDHLNIWHNYTCQICNERVFSLEDLIQHKLKHNTTYTQNTLQS